MKRFFAVFACLFATAAVAEPTDITVRVISKGAKFVGTSMGGVRVTLRDAHTGAILASGLTEGSTGDTSRIMTRARRGELGDPSAAAFRATIDLDIPTLVQVEASGPVAQAQAAVRVTSMQWVAPGRPAGTGDGWVLELPGLAVDVQAPGAHQRLGSTKSVEVRANVVMMCGCPIEPGGTWDANRFDVEALVRRDGKPVGRTALGYAGATSQFAGQVPVSGPGAYEVTVVAYDKTDGNTGVDRTTFIVP